MLEINVQHAGQVELEELSKFGLRVMKVLGSKIPKDAERDLISYASTMLATNEHTFPVFKGIIDEAEYVNACRLVWQVRQLITASKDEHLRTAVASEEVQQSGHLASLFIKSHSSINVLGGTTNKAIYEV